jgi:hypothetical protein
VLLKFIEKTKQTCFTNFSIMYFYYCKFWFVNVQGGTWCFCIGYEFLGKKNGFLNTLQLAYLKCLNIRANIGKKFARPLWAIWAWPKRSLFMLNMKAQIQIPWRIVVLKSIVNCETLGLMKSFQGICFGQGFSICNYI